MTAPELVPDDEPGVVAPSAGSAGGSTAFMSIGEVLGQLRSEFPDITISKIRFLESEGLVEPQRTASGYRKFSRDDVTRLRYVLAAQRDNYLPLRVIKQHLAAKDRGLEPPAAGQSMPQLPADAALDGLPTASDFVPEASELRLSRDELRNAAGLSEDQLAQIESFGLLTPGSGSFYDGDCLLIAKTVAEMARFGLEPRHLRAFRTAAEREVGLVEQLVSPLARQRTPEARGKADEMVRELASLSVRLHATLVRAALRPQLGN